MSFTRNHLGLFVSLIVLNILDFCTYGIPVTYFPNVAKLRGLSDLEIGAIFSMYSLVSFLSSFGVIKILNRIDRKIVVVAAQPILGIATLLFGFAAYFDSNAAFIASAAIGRGLQGLAIGAYVTTSYAYVPDVWPDDIDRRIIICEFFLALGIGVGPLLGSAIYESWGYLWIYVLPGVTILIGGSLLTLVFFPRMDHIAPGNTGKIEVKKERLAIGESLRIKAMIYLILANVFTLTALTFIMPDFENKVIAIGGGPVTSSVIFSMEALGYMFACLFLLFAKFENRQGFLFLSLVCMVFGLLFLALDLVFEMNDIAVFVAMGAGLFAIGWSISFSFIPFISEAVYILKGKFKDKKEETLSNMAAGLFNAAVALAEFQGPIIGGLLQDLTGFSQSCAILAGISAIFFMVFATHGDGFTNFKRFFRKAKEESHFSGELLLVPSDDN